MPLPQSAIEARARREMRQQAHLDRMQERRNKKVTASRYGYATRDSDIIAPDSQNLTMKETPLDAYKRVNAETDMDRTMRTEMLRNKN